MLTLTFTLTLTLTFTLTLTLTFTLTFTLVYVSRPRDTPPPSRTMSKNHKARWIRLSETRKLAVGRFSDADHKVLREWARMFRTSQHPDVTLQSEDRRSITQHNLKLGRTRVLTIVSAWQMFHERLGSPTVFAIQSSGLEYIRVRWTAPVNPIPFVNEHGEVVNVQTFPTHPFEGVFRVSDIPPGTYTYNGLTFTRTIGETKLVEPLDFETVFDEDVFEPMPEDHVQRAWQQAAEVLEHRGHRIATEEEVQSFISIYSPKGISFCMDPLRSHGERIRWRSPEFIATFGDVHWLDVESHNYNDVVIGVLKHLPHLGDFTMRDVHGQKRTFHTRVVYGLKSASHALLIGTWFEGDVPNVLTRFCEHEKRLDPTFTPTPLMSIRAYFNARRMMYSVSGYRVANDDEIAAARARVTNEFGVVMDFMLSFDDAYVWMSETSVRVFGKWPPIELTGQWWEYLNLAPSGKIPKRVKTRSGEILTGTSLYEFLNDETRLLIVNSVYENTF